MDFNAFVEEFASLVAVKVARELRKENLRGNDWPQVEVKSARPEPVEEVENTVSEDNVAVVPAVPAPKIANSNEDLRRSVLGRVNIRTLRNKIAAVESKEAADYSHLSKDDLVEYVVKFESLIGRTIEEEQDRMLIAAGLKVDTSNVEDDTDFTEVEPEDDTEVAPLTREDAERLPLAEVKTLALANGTSEDDLKGLDVKAVVDLLFGVLESEEAPVASEDKPAEAEDEEIELTEDDINAMSIGELKSLIDDLNEQGAGLTYTRATLRGELIDLIFSALEEEDE